MEDHSRKTFWGRFRSPIVMREDISVEVDNEHIRVLHTGDNFKSRVGRSKDGFPRG